MSAAAQKVANAAEIYGDGATLLAEYHFAAKEWYALFGVKHPCLRYSMNP